jgi:hypothetical protein
MLYRIQISDVIDFTGYFIQKFRFVAGIYVRKYQQVVNKPYIPLNFPDRKTCKRKTLSLKMAKNNKKLMVPQC